MFFSVANFWIGEITDLPFSLEIIPNMGVWGPGPPEKLCDFDVKGQLF